MNCYKCGQSILKEEAYHGLHPGCYMQWFGLSELLPINDLAMKNFSSSMGRKFHPATDSFFQGKFKKYAGKIGQNFYIFKIQEEKFPELPAMEYLCNQLAEAVGLNVPEYYFLKLENVAQCFVTKNFMQKHVDKNLVHIYHLLEEGQYHCEALIAAIIEKTKRIADVERFIHLCLFDALIGNHDRHGRNLACIQTAQSFQLSPSYDNPSYLSIEDEYLLAAHHEPRGKITTQATKEPTMKDYVVEFERLGYKDIIERFYKRVDLKEIEGLVNSAFVSESRKLALLNLIRRRQEELKNGLAK